ncbi:MAG TPA: class I fructose-bisphosphate aldolase, partial [Trinickia sp.]
EPPLKIWRGQPANVSEAQRALSKRARLNSAASLGRYDAKDESTS